MDSQVLPKPLTVEEIDTKIQELEHSLRTLRSLRNDLCPAYRLPEEVLTRIFSFLQRMRKLARKDSPSDSESSQEDIRWITVTHVSRRWREAALNCGTLWTMIPLKNSAFEEWIQRSQKCLITVKLRKFTPDLLPRVLVVLQELPRIRSLGLITIPIALWGEIVPALASPAPALEFLSMSIKPDHDLEPEPLPPVLSGAFPKLQKLFLHGIGFDFARPSRRLTHITINFPPTQVSPHSMLSVLQFTPNLMFLSILWAFEPPQRERNLAEMETNAELRVNLKRLETLILKYIDTEQGLQFLSRLSIYRKASLQFHNWDGNRSLDDLSRILNASAQIYNAPLLPYHTLRISDGSPGSRPFELWRMSSTGSLRLYLDITIRLNEDTIASLDLHTLDPQVRQAMSHITSFGTGDHFDNWNNVLSPLLHLRQLSLRRSAVQSFFVYLSNFDLLPSDSGDNDAEIESGVHTAGSVGDILPELEEISISCPRYEQITFEVLESVLTIWKKQARPLVKLTIENADQIKGDIVFRLMALLKNGEVDIS